MKNLRLKSILSGLMAVFAVVLMMTSCEQEAIKGLTENIPVENAEINIENGDLTPTSISSRGANSLSWDTPTSISNGNNQVALDYSINQNGIVLVQIYNPNWQLIGAVHKNVSAGSASLTLTLPVSGAAPSNNHLQAKLFNSGWGDMGVPRLYVNLPLSGIPTATNTLSWNPPTSISNGNNQVTVDYSINQNGIVLVQIYNPNWQLIGQVYENVSAGSASLTLTLPANGAAPSNNHLQAKLFNSGWGDMGVPRLYTNLPLGTTTEGTLISNIFGFAAEAGVTGGSNVVVVSNLAQLKAAVSAGGNYVKISPSLAGGHINLRTGDNLYFGNSTTLDGSDAPGFELRVLPNSKTPADKVHAILLNEGNCIVHDITIKGFYNGTNGDSSSGIFGRTGIGYWIDHVTITGLDDDAIAFGDANRVDSANKVTVSFCHIYDTDKAVLLTHSGTAAQGNPKGFTFAYNKLNGSIRDRIPVADGVQDFHWYNNYVHDTNGLYAEIGKYNVGGNETTALFENNFYTNQSGLSGPYAIQEKTGQGSWSGVSWLYHNGLNGEGNDINGQLAIGVNLLDKGSNRGPGVSIPYAYDLKPANDVPAYVDANAGATN